jgi:hypothetical protein
MKRNALVLLIIFVQLGIAFFLSIGIYHKQKQKKVLGEQSAQVLQEDDYIVSTNDSLKYFYEPEANNKIVEHPSWLNYDATYTINSDGLNDSNDYPVQKESETFRIITLGDSFTYGAYINTGNNWTEVLESELNSNNKCSNIRKYEILNLGVGGYDLEYEINRFISRGIKYNPDFIILFIKDDDFEIINELLFPIEMEMRGKLGVTKEDNKYYYDNGTYYPTWSSAMKILLEIYGEDYILDYQRKQLGILRNKYGGKLLIITPWLKPQYESLIKEVFAGYGNYFMKRLTNVYSKNLILFDGHPNTEGHRKIAEQVDQYMDEIKLACD